MNASTAPRPGGDPAAVVPRPAGRGHARTRRIGGVASTLLLLPGTAPAQLATAPNGSHFWITGIAATAGALLVDEQVRELAARNQAPSRARVARTVDPFGRARYLVPALVASTVVLRLGGASEASTAVVRIGLGYAAADGLESVLKSGVGRHRPDSSGRPFRFRPLRLGGPWTSFPSAHTTHAMALAMALATGIALEAHRPWATALAFSVGAAVALQRLYTEAHWTSDVVGSTVLAVGASATTIEWLAHGKLRRGRCRDETPSTAVRLRVGPHTVAINIDY